MARPLDNFAKPLTKQCSTAIKGIAEESIAQCSPATIDSAQPSIEKCSSAEANVVARIDFAVGDVVWAKFKGFPHWPARITAFTSKLMVEVFWFNDYRRTRIYRTQLFTFLPHFEEFSLKFDDHIGLRTAAREAMIYFGNSLQLTQLF